LYSTSLWLRKGHSAPDGRGEGDAATVREGEVGGNCGGSWEETEQRATRQSTARTLALRTKRRMRENCKGSPDRWRDEHVLSPSGGKRGSDGNASTNQSSGQGDCHVDKTIENRLKSFE